MLLECLIKQQTPLSRKSPTGITRKRVMWALELLPVRLPESMFIPFVKANSEPSWLRVWNIQLLSYILMGKTPPKSWRTVLGGKRREEAVNNTTFVEKTNDRWFCLLRPRYMEGIRSQLLTTLTPKVLYIKFWHQLVGNHLKITIQEQWPFTEPSQGVSYYAKHTIFVIPLNFHNNRMKYFPLLWWGKWGLEKLNNLPKIIQLVNAPMLLASVPCPAFLLMVVFILTWISLGRCLFLCKLRAALHSCQIYFFQNSKCLQEEAQFIIRNLTFQINCTLLKWKDQLPFFWYV